MTTQLAVNIRCQVCSDPRREQIEEWLDSRYKLPEICRALGTASPSEASLRRHRKRHMPLSPAHPERVVNVAIGQGARQLRDGDIRLTASSLAAFVRLRKEMDAEASSKVSEHLLAEGVNIMLTELRLDLDPGALDAYRERIWPQLTALISTGVMPAARIREPGPGENGRAPGIPCGTGWPAQENEPVRADGHEPAHAAGPFRAGATGPVQAHEPGQADDGEPAAPEDST
jgi:hypothetical protein